MGSALSLADALAKRIGRQVPGVMRRILGEEHPDAGGPRQWLLANPTEYDEADSETIPPGPPGY